MGVNIGHPTLFLMDVERCGMNGKENFSACRVNEKREVKRGVRNDSWRWWTRNGPARYAHSEFMFGKRRKAKGSSPQIDYDARDHDWLFLLHFLGRRELRSVVFRGCETFPASIGFLLPSAELPCPEMEKRKHKPHQLRPTAVIIFYNNQNGSRERERTTWPSAGFGNSFNPSHFFSLFFLLAKCPGLNSFFSPFNKRCENVFYDYSTKATKSLGTNCATGQSRSPPVRKWGGKNVVNCFHLDPSG